MALAGYGSSDHAGAGPGGGARGGLTPSSGRLRKIIESDRPFSLNPDSHFHRKRTPVFMRADSLGVIAAAHAEVVSGV